MAGDSARQVAHQQLPFVAVRTLRVADFEVPRYRPTTRILLVVGVVHRATSAWAGQLRCRGVETPGVICRRSARPCPAAAVPLVVLMLVLVGTPAARAAGPVAGDPGEGWATTGWRRYLLAPEGSGPDGRMVAPAAVLGSGATERPEGLLAADGRSARLRRELTGGSARWPEGTAADASSRLPGHPAGAAVDGDGGTWWQDATPSARPDVLTVSTPRPVTLPGVTLVSSSRGWVVDAEVEVLQGGVWRRVGEVAGAATLTTPVRFAAPVTTSGLRVRVLRAWANPSFPLRQREHAKLVEVLPGLVEEAYVDLDFGREVAGRLEVRVAGASRAAPAVRLAVAELRRDLSPRSDYSHGDYGPDLNAGGGDEGPGTEAFQPDPGGQVWTATGRCLGSVRPCAQGVRAFRYARVYLGIPEGGGDGHDGHDGRAGGPYGQVDIDAVGVRFTPFLGTPGVYDGWFASTDETLTRAWYAGVYTAELVTDTVREPDVDPRGCAHPDLEGKVLYLDGAKRDRCPYGGGADIAMLASYVAHPDPAPITNQLRAFAQRQAPDGWIPGSPIRDFGIRYPDAPGRWVTTLHKYALWSGDLAFVREHWANLVGVLDTWYPQITSPRGLASGSRALRGADRQLAVTDPAGARAASLFHEDLLLSTEQVIALRNGADLAEALGDPYRASAEGWRARASAVAEAVNRHLWDPAAGAYRQSVTRGCHPQWNALAVLAGVTDPGRAGQALDHLRSLALPYGNPYNDDGRACPLFGQDTSKLVYGEGGAWEVLARFHAGRDLEALDQLRRTYGWQLEHDPGSTVWEGWGAPGGDPSALFGRYFTSMAHGHMAGAAPVLTTAVLGAAPAGFGFATYRVAPHPGDVASARGVVPTPKGPLRVAWRRAAGRFDLLVAAPGGTSGQVGVPTFGQRVRVEVDGRTVWDGARARSSGVRAGGGYVWVDGLPPGDHRIRGVELAGGPAAAAAGASGDGQAAPAPGPGRKTPERRPDGRPAAATWVPRRYVATTVPRTVRPA